jgi:hypothetical protein
MKPNVEKRSPLKEKPLRYAGQSLDDQILDKRDDSLICITMMFMLIPVVGAARTGCPIPTEPAMPTFAIVPSTWTIV